MHAYLIQVTAPRLVLGGKYAVFAVGPDGKVRSQRTGIRTAERARLVAFDYSRQYGDAPIVYGAGCQS